MSEDMETRRLAYLNAMARPDADAKALRKEYSDVVAHLKSESAPPKSKAPAGAGSVAGRHEREPASIKELIKRFGALDVAVAAAEGLTKEEAELFVTVLGERLAANDETAGAAPNNDGETASQDNSQANNSRLPAGWRDMQWKQRVKLAEGLGGTPANADEANVFLEEIEKQDKASA
jgi:hypothetical protein